MINKKKESSISHTTFSSGEYLSVFYKFERENFGKLKLLKKKTDEYLIEKGYTLKDHRVIEIEHPELSLFLEDESYIYEIQMLIENE